MKKVALITGITGQDGAYLADLLLKKDYLVHGIKRRSSSFNTARIDHLYQDPHIDKINFVLHHGDLTDSTNLIRIIQEIKPDEIYNLAAQSHLSTRTLPALFSVSVNGGQPLHDFFCLCVPVIARARGLPGLPYLRALAPNRLTGPEHFAGSSGRHRPRPALAVGRSLPLHG